MYTAHYRNAGVSNAIPELLSRNKGKRNLDWY